MKPENLNINMHKLLSQDWGLVTAGTAEKANTMTVGWGGIGTLWGKNVIYIFIRDSRYTKEFIDQGETFSLAFFDEKWKKALTLCGKESGRDIDKWAQTGLTPAIRNETVYPQEASLAFLCRKLAAVPLGEETFIDPEIMPKWYSDHDMHVMYVGEILEIIG